MAKNLPISAFIRFGNTMTAAMIRLGIGPGWKDGPADRFHGSRRVRR